MGPELANLIIGVTVDQNGARTGLAATEQHVAQSAKKMEKSLGEAFVFAKFASSFRALRIVAESEFSASNLAIAAFTGNVGGAVREIEKLADAIRDLPLVGDAFVIGQAVGGSPFGKGVRKGANEIRSMLPSWLGGITDEERNRANIGIDSEETPEQRAAREKRKVEAERARIEMAKRIAEVDRRIMTTERENMIRGAASDPLRQARLRAEFRRDDALQGAAGVGGEREARLKAAADRQFQLDLIPKLTKESLSATALGLNLPTQDAQNREAPKAKQIDETNRLLRELTKQQRIAVAA